MKGTGDSSQREKEVQKLAIEAALRIALLGALLAWCFMIMRPFIDPLIWAVIIAAALNSLFLRFRDGWLGGRNKLAATLFTLIVLLVLLVPTTQLTLSMIEGVEQLTTIVDAGDFAVPAPPEKVADWPLIGERLYGGWSLAHANTEAALQNAQPQLKQLGAWMLATAAGGGVTMLKFLLSIVIAGVFLATGPTAVAALARVSIKLAGDQGADFAELAGATVRSVAQGVLGVAVIQAFLAGVGMLVVGIPGAGLWALLILMMAIVQLPPLLVLGPVIVYVFSIDGASLSWVLFTAWSLLVSFSDSFLKPLLLGRGMKVPTLVIFIGVIGGFMLSGFIGLFTGAVIFVLGYTLFMAWLGDMDGTASSEVTAD